MFSWLDHDHDVDEDYDGDDDDDNDMILLRVYPCLLFGVGGVWSNPLRRPPKANPTCLKAESQCEVSFRTAGICCSWYCSESSCRCSLFSDDYTGCYRQFDDLVR